MTYLLYINIIIIAIIIYPGPDNITCVQYSMIQQFSAIHFANHLVLPVVYDRESFLVVCECRDSDQS